MKYNTLRYILLFASIILLGLNLYAGLFENDMNYYNIASNSLLAFAMIMGIRENKPQL